MPITPLLERLAAAFRGRMGFAAGRASFLIGFAALLIGAHIARIGTLWARLAVGLCLLLLLGLYVARAYFEKRAWRDAQQLVKRVLFPTNRELGERTLRALGLVERTQRDETSGSPELAEFHLEQLLRRTSLDEVRQGAARAAAPWRWAGYSALIAGLLAIVLGPLRIVEGLDVLLARDGRAPLPMTWLNFVRVSSRPPSYLREPNRLIFQSFGSEQPQGSVLTVRGVPRYQGRKLVLTDGKQEVPFISDGAGGLVANWPLRETSELRVAARFGDVLIVERESVHVRALKDEAPNVALEGAPRSLPLKDLERLELRYVARDDHGLKQIDLVLRSGGREERRSLMRLDGEDRVQAGGHALAPGDPFLKRMFLPISITIEARDNDPVFGPKWGRSQAITLLPPAVGAPQAERFVALREAENRLVDAVALFRDLPHAASPKQRAELRRRAKQASEAAISAMRDAVTQSYSGLDVPSGLRAFLLGQLSALERRSRSGVSELRQTEDALLAIDVALRAMGRREAKAVAVRLADVVEEIADGAKQARETEQQFAGLDRLRVALKSSELGARELLKLGVLGRDLGSVAVGDLDRVRRSEKLGDLLHTELAARHLAARLRRPNPSFSSAGGGGVESGGGGSGPPSAAPSQADEHFDRMAQELAELAEEHSAEIGGVERALSDAKQSVKLEDLKEEAQRRAEAIRRDTSSLPPIGARPGTARADAALGREHARSMAQGLEQLSLAEAARSGRAALNALKEAERKAADAVGFGDWLDTEGLRQARERISQELEWVEQQLERAQGEANARAQKALEGASARERDMARRAGNLAGRGKGGQAALPEEMVESLENAETLMRRAAGELEAGRPERALELQREAQRLLESADKGKTSDPGEDAESDQRGESGHKDKIRTGGEVPDADKRKRAEDFRRRVLEGLGQGERGGLSPAVKRYAEGLLR